MVISRSTIGKDKNPRKMTPNQRQIQLNMIQVWSMSFFYVCNVSKYNKERLLDFGALHHICPHKGWFSSYQTVNDGIVLLGDNHSCKTVGVGSVKTKMFDGVIRTLTDVRHVFELEKNNFFGSVGFLWS